MMYRDKLLQSEKLLGSLLTLKVKDISHLRGLYCMITGSSEAIYFGPRSKRL